MSWSRLPPPPRRTVGCKSETRRSCGASIRVGSRGGSERRRRSRVAEFPDGDAQSLRLVGEVVLDSSARKMHDADWQQFEHRVVALERRCLGMSGPVWLERDLWHLPGGRPFRGDQFGALWRAGTAPEHVAE